jgi:hypothetical protein
MIGEIHEMMSMAAETTTSARVTLVRDLRTWDLETDFLLTEIPIIITMNKHKLPNRASRPWPDT